MTEKSGEHAEGGEEGFDPEQAEALRERLLRWYEHNRRDLPWRDSGDAYAIWVSEIMLQQTRVATVLEYYRRWMERFPDVDALAEAELDEVLELWAGLGYYRRARMLHRAARQVVDELGGQLPADARSLRALPGVGPYTAGAIASIAYNERAPLVDGNVERVFARLKALGGDPKGRDNQKRFWRLAGSLIEGAERPGDLNQALMELGATVCTPTSPSCLLCPVRTQCEALALGDPSEYPGKIERTAPRPVALVAAVAEDPQGHVFLERRPTEGLLGGTWGFPLVELSDDSTGGGDPAQALIVALPALSAAAQIQSLGEVHHVLSHLRMTLHVVHLRLSVRPPMEAAGDQRWRWLGPEELDALGMPRVFDKVRALWRRG